MRDFNHTVGVLVKAYMNDTLVHGDCSACAVGNIIAENIGATVCIDKSWFDGDWVRVGVCGEEKIAVVWSAVFCTSNGVQDIQPRKYIGSIKQQIDASGYSWQELARIEYAFETAPKPHTDVDPLDPEWMFNGLMAVVDVLADIHGIDLQQKEEAKALFVKH